MCVFTSHMRDRKTLYPRIRLAAESRPRQPQDIRAEGEKPAAYFDGETRCNGFGEVCDKSKTDHLLYHDKNPHRCPLHFLPLNEFTFHEPRMKHPYTQNTRDNTQTATDGVLHCLFCLNLLYKTAEKGTLKIMAQVLATTLHREPDSQARGCAQCSVVALFVCIIR